MSGEIQGHGTGVRASGEFGMFVFLISEGLLFSALVLGYVVARLAPGADFGGGSRELSLPLGTINTAVLLSSSFAIALSTIWADDRRDRRARLAALATVLLGIVFLCIKGTEYWLEYQEHLAPALNFDLAKHGGVAEIFFMFYFCATGLHALHLLIGIGMVAWLATWIGTGRIDRGGSTTRLIGLYWHFVDVVWIFLFPLIYLAGRNG